MRERRQVSALQSASRKISSARFSCIVLFLVEIGAFVVGKTNIKAKIVWFTWWALAIIVFALVIAIRIRLLGIPLERDEGEYAIPAN